MESEDEPIESGEPYGEYNQDEFDAKVKEAIAQIQEQYWKRVRDELKNLLTENPEVRAKLLSTPSPTTEDDFLDMMLVMMKEEADKNETILDV
jgi:hypothetical protein